MNSLVFMNNQGINILDDVVFLYLSFIKSANSLCKFLYRNDGIYNI